MSKAITLTPSLAYASGQDAGNAHMRKHGRKRWNDADWNVAAETTSRLLLHCIENPELRSEIARREGIALAA